MPLWYGEQRERNELERSVNLGGEQNYLYLNLHSEKLCVYTQFNVDQVVTLNTDRCEFHCV